MEDVLEVNIDIPPQIEAVMDKEKKSLSISNYEELKAFLNGQTSKG